MPTRSSPLPLLLLALLSACASEGETPSLAPRPMEYELAGRPLPPCLAGAAPAAPAGSAEAAPADDPQLAAHIETLLGNARSGQADFAAALPGAQRSASRAGAAGTESWIAAQQELSRLEAARARTASALAELDSLFLARSGAPASADDLQRIGAASEEVRALADAQDAEIGRLNAALSGPSALRREPLQAPHNAQRPPAARQALAASDRGHISPGGPPRAARTGPACRG